MVGLVGKWFHQEVSLYYKDRNEVWRRCFPQYLSRQSSILTATPPDTHIPSPQNLDLANPVFPYIWISRCLTLCQLSQDISSYHCKSFFEENRNEYFLLNLNFFNIVCQVKKKKKKPYLHEKPTFYPKKLYVKTDISSRGSLVSWFLFSFCLFVDFLLIFSRFFCTQLFRSSSSLDLALTFIFPYVHFYSGLDKIKWTIQFFKFIFFFQIGPSCSFSSLIEFPY